MAAPPAKKKKVAGWVIALIVVGINGIVVFLIVLAGGAYLASRIASQNNLTTAVPGIVETAKDFSTLLPDATSLQPYGTLVAAPPGIYGEGTPFQSIEGFPTDIPILTNNNGDLITSSSQGVMMYIFSTNLPLKEVADFYLTGMASNSWQKMSETTQTGMYYWTFMKENETRQVIIIIASDSGSPVQVSIMIQQQ